jgi:hypothetical protein
MATNANKYINGFANDISLQLPKTPEEICIPNHRVDDFGQNLFFRGKEKPLQTAFYLPQSDPATKIVLKMQSREDLVREHNGEILFRGFSNARRVPIGTKADSEANLYRAAVIRGKVFNFAKAARCLLRQSPNFARLPKRDVSA